MSKRTLIYAVVLLAFICDSLFFFHKLTNGYAKARTVRLEKKKQPYNPILKTISNQKVPKNNQKHYRLVILITSAPEYREKREAIRSTWASTINANSSVFYRFVISNSTIENRTLSIIQEMSEFSDILWFPFFIDHYNSSTHKVFTFYQWLNEQAKTERISFDWVLKTVDDSWFNLELALKELETIVPKRFIWSNFQNNAPVFRKAHRNIELVFDADIYPMFPAGAGYIISYDLVSWLATQWGYGWLWKYSHDDTAIAIYMSAIKPKKKNDFRRWFRDVRKSSPQTKVECEMVLLLHPLSPKDIIKIQGFWDRCKSVCLCQD